MRSGASGASAALAPTLARAGAGAELAGAALAAGLSGELTDLWQPDPETRNVAVHSTIARNLGWLMIFFRLSLVLSFGQNSSDGLEHLSPARRFWDVTICLVRQRELTQRLYVHAAREDHFRAQGALPLAHQGQ